MKLRTILLTLCLGLFTMSSVSFASDGTTTAKVCSIDDDLSLSNFLETPVSYVTTDISYEVVTNVERFLDECYNSNEFAILATIYMEIMIADDHPLINEWLRHKKYLEHNTSNPTTAHVGKGYRHTFNC